MVFIEAKEEKTDWFAVNSAELSVKYIGKHMAIVKDKVVAVGDSAIEVFKKAKEKFPKEEISLVYIPTDKEVTTLLWNSNM